MRRIRTTMSKKEKDLNVDFDLSLHEESQDVKQTNLVKDKTDYNKVSKKIEIGGTKILSVAYKIIAAIGMLIFISMMLYAVSFLPRIGGRDNPTQNEVMDEYIQNGKENTGADNVVTGIILDYRGFDTLGESFVLFTATLCVFVLLYESKPKKKIEKFKLSDDVIVTSFAKILVPVIFMFALYVLFNGESSPGGGFSGGTIMGVGLMLFSMAYGDEKAKKLFNKTTFKVLMATALIVYVGVKFYAFFTQLTAKEALGGYIMLIMDLCVGCVVACTMYAFYSIFTKGEI